MRDWIDNADSYICPNCRYEVLSPAQYPGYACPECGWRPKREEKKKMASCKVELCTCLRPCMVNDKRALFHQWTHEAEIKQAYLRGSVGGQLASTFGIVEYEDGKVSLVYPSAIRFLDHYFDEYSWEDGYDRR